MSLILSGTDGLSDIDGSAATPAIRGTDANTGIFFGTDIIGFSEGGVEAMRIDSDGDVGIGITSIAGKLHVYAGASVGELIIGYNATSNNYYDADTQIFRNAGKTERMRLDSSGNLQFNSGYGSVATAYACRAWVNFNGTGTVAIRASGNVSSITDNGTGNYRVNFTTAISDANYSANVTVSLDGTPNVSGTVRQCMVNSSGTMTTTYCEVSSFATTGTSVSDAAVMNVAIFR